MHRLTYGGSPRGLRDVVGFLVDRCVQMGQEGARCPPRRGDYSVDPPWLLLPCSSPISELIGRLELFSEPGIPGHWIGRPNLDHDCPDGPPRTCTSAPGPANDHSPLIGAAPTWSSRTSRCASSSRHSCGRDVVLDSRRPIEAYGSRCDGLGGAGPMPWCSSSRRPWWHGTGSWPGATGS